jgi:hypothetical protein
LCEPLGADLGLMVLEQLADTGGVVLRGHLSVPYFGLFSCRAIPVDF